MSEEFLNISKCAKCNKPHRYRLEVERSIIMKLMTPDDLNEKPRQVRITRIFTCPVKNEEFEARFILHDTSSDRIENVTISGVSNDES